MDETIAGSIFGHRRFRRQDAFSRIAKSNRHRLAAELEYLITGPSLRVFPFFVKLTRDRYHHVRFPPKFIYVFNRYIIQQYYFHLQHLVNSIVFVVSGRNRGLDRIRIISFPIIFYLIYDY